MNINCLALSLSISLAMLTGGCLDAHQAAQTDASSPPPDEGARSDSAAPDGSPPDPVGDASGPLEVASSVDAVVQAETQPPVPECKTAGEACAADGGCCSGICTSGAHGPGYCIDAVDDGAYCAADHWCKSDRCAEETCIPQQCVASGSDCRVDVACCSGICSYMGVYTLETTCIEARRIGEACSRDNWCESGFCVNGVCAIGACLAQGSDCSWDALRCCYPSFCSWRGDYALGYCTLPQPAGAYCHDASWCESGACTDEGVCK